MCDLIWIHVSLEIDMGKLRRCGGEVIQRRVKKWAVARTDTGWSIISLTKIRTMWRNLGPWLSWASLHHFLYEPVQLIRRMSSSGFICLLDDVVVYVGTKSTWYKISKYLSNSWRNTWNNCFISTLIQSVQLVVTEWLTQSRRFGLISIVDQITLSFYATCQQFEQWVKKTCQC